MTISDDLQFIFMFPEVGFQPRVGATATSLQSIAYFFISIVFCS
jgi:hypothetical protein